MPNLISKETDSIWVVESADKIAGSFGIESRNFSNTELRRMYLDEGYRGLGIAQPMLACAQTAARTWIHKDDSEHGSDPESSRSRRRLTCFYFEKAL